MPRSKPFHLAWLVPFRLAIAIAMVGSTIETAQAVPAFADQTGQPCSSCHVGGFGPQLTPFGREFKILGYTPRSQEGTIPVSAMAIASYLHTVADQPAAPHYAPNDNTTLDQISVFLAGGISANLGGFSQFTYDGVARAFTWDNLDLRVVDQLTVAKTDVVIGLLEPIDGLRGLDAGSLSQAAAIEAFTAVAITLNIRYKTHSTIKMAGL